MPEGASIPIARVGEVMVICGNRRDGDVHESEELGQPRVVLDVRAVDQ